MVTNACVGEATIVFTVAVLFAAFGSETELAICGELVMVVPPAVPAFTLTTSGKLTLAPTARVWPLFKVHVNVPVPPTGMLLQDQFAGGVNDTNVVFAGIVSVKVTVVTGAEVDAVMAVGPRLVTDCV